MPEFKIKKNKHLCPKGRGHRTNVESKGAKKNKISFEEKVYNLKVGK